MTQHSFGSKRPASVFDGASVRSVKHIDEGKQ